MNILYLVRKDASEIFGGDIVQYENTRNFLLKKYNTQITIRKCDDIDNININNFDLIHIWGLFVFNENFCKKAKEKNKKIVLSSIFWDVTDVIFINYLYKICYMLPFNILKIMQKFIIWFAANVLYNVIPLYAKRKESLFLHKKNKLFRKNTVAISDIIIPNSDEEGKVLCNKSDITIETCKNKFVSIPNAVDIDFIKTHKDNGFMDDIKDFVIEAARIEPLKNQLGVIKSMMKNPEIPIIIAGAVPQKQQKYYETVRKLAKKRGNVYFIDNVSQENLFSLYKRAKVHVLPSFRESPGLATLEALMCGTQIVVSDEKYCPIKYYQFDKYGFVCNPYDVKSIRNAILEAYNNPKNINLTEEYINFFSYENVADMTYEVYKKLLNEQ